MFRCVIIVLSAIINILGDSQLLGGMDENPIVFRYISFAKYYRLSESIFQPLQSTVVKRLIEVYSREIGILG